MKKRELLPLALAAALLILATVWLTSSGVLDRFGDWQALNILLDQIGNWSLLFLLAAQAVQVLIPIIPSQLLGMASGFLYGIFWGTMLSAAGVSVGSLIATNLARHYGRPYVERHATAETIDRIDAIARRFGSWGFFFVALIPFLPTDIGCFVAGLTSLRTRSVILPIMLGRLPGILVLNYLGTTSKEISLETMVIITTFTLVVAGILWVFRESLESMGHRLLNRLGIH